MYGLHEGVTSSHPFPWNQNPSWRESQAEFSWRWVIVKEITPFLFDIIMRSLCWWWPACRESSLDAEARAWWQSDDISSSISKPLVARLSREKYDEMKRSLWDRCSWARTYNKGLREKRLWRVASKFMSVMSLNFHRFSRESEEARCWSHHRYKNSTRTIMFLVGDNIFTGAIVVVWPWT